MTAQPIFFAATRSFWFTVGGLALIMEQGEPVVRAFASILVALVYQLGWTWQADEITAWVMDIAPAVLWIAALQQRSGASRPYTMDRKAK